MAIEPDDYDSPWKDALETFLPDCLALFFRQAHAAIDWTKPHTFLDQELRQIQREAEVGRQVVDKLVQVALLDGRDAWVLIHIEVQSQPEPNFAKRMFTYYYRLLDRFDRPVVSLAILGDERATWRPERYEADLWGYGVRFTFRAVKLLDYRANLTQLEENRNPFATIVLAHLRAQESRRDPNARMGMKLDVLRRLYAQGYNREQIVGLFRFVDWLMALPPELERRFRAELEAFEQEQTMPYITSVERIGREEGREEGLQAGREEGLQVGREEGMREGLLAGIELALRIKFGSAGQELVPEIRQIIDLTTIRAIHDRIEAAQTIDDVRRVYS
jgi:hypothetical protein